MYKLATPLKHHVEERRITMHTGEYVKMPKAVYYQCLWTVKDIDRLYRLEAMMKHEKSEDEVVLYEDEGCMAMNEEVLRQASWKLSCIKDALNVIPQEYRIETIESIVDGVFPTGIAHENTWKKWRRVFIKELAHKLNLI